MKTIAVFKATLTRSELQAQLDAYRVADRVTDALCEELERPSSLGLDMDLRHLSGQVARQRALPRDASRDGRFLLHLEHALRDLAVRAPVLPGATS